MEMGKREGTDIEQPRLITEYMNLSIASLPAYGTI